MYDIKEIYKLFILVSQKNMSIKKDPKASNSLKRTLQQRRLWFSLLEYMKTGNLHPGL